MGLEHVKRALGMAWRGFGFFPDSSHPACSEDIVVPIGVFDNNFIIRNQFIRLVYRFDCVLDAAKLRTTLEELIALHGWEKLGARLRAVNGQLEYHIPRSFGQDRPPLRFRLQDLSATTIHDHGIIARACTTDFPSIATGTYETSQFFEDHADIGYFITQDVPLFGLEIVHFADATLLCLSWPHLLMDGAGIGLLLRSWAAQLRVGNKALPRPCKPTDEPLAHLGLHKRTGFWLEERLRSTFSFILEFSLLQNIAGILEGTEPRSVLLPAPFAHSLRGQPQSVSNSPTSRSEFVSEGDLVSAWWVKQVTSRCTSRFVQTIVVYQLVALHSRTDSKLRDPNLAYIGNAIGFVPTLIPRSDLEQHSIVELALRMRRSLENTVEASQLNAWAALFRESSFQLMPNFGHGVTFSMVISNASKLKVMDIDFNDAVLHIDKSMAQQPLSSMPSAIYNFQDFAFPNFFTILAKDQLENTIITGNLRRKEWDMIEKDWVAGEFNAPSHQPMAKL